MKFNKSKSEQGQTLIETMVAVFIMVMGITAALGLAIYSFNATSLINKQVVGMGLAREGVEAVKNMRDTNWLKASNFDVSCNCYTDWQSSYYTVVASDKGAGYSLDFNPYQAPYWSLDPLPLSYRLTYDPDSENGRLYYPAINPKNENGKSEGEASEFLGFGEFTSTAVESDYYRRITIIEHTEAPYDTVSPRLEVTTDVWWTDRKCNEAQVFEDATPSCRISLKSYLTNWKNY